MDIDHARAEWRYNPRPQTGEGIMDRETALRVLTDDATLDNEARMELAAARLGCSLNAIYHWPKAGHLSLATQNAVLAACVRHKTAQLVAAGVEVPPLHIEAVKRHDEDALAA